MQDNLVAKLPKDVSIFSLIKPGNFVMIYGAFTFLVIFGGVGEKLAICDPSAKAYETQRRMRRAFIPYTLVGYRWRYPSNQ